MELCAICESADVGGVIDFVDDEDWIWDTGWGEFDCYVWGGWEVKGGGVGADCFA